MEAGVGGGGVRDRAAAAVRGRAGRARARARRGRQRASATCTRSTRRSSRSRRGKASYRRRLESAYPIHPELFDQLFENWSTLEKFQRTRGVLRLMAAVIHELWERDDAGLLIMPASVPIDAPRGAGGADPLPRGGLDAGDRVRRRRAERAAAPARPREPEPQALQRDAAGRAHDLHGLGADARPDEPGDRRPLDQARLRAAGRVAGDVRRRAAAARDAGDVPRRGPRPVLVLARADDRPHGRRPQRSRASSRSMPTRRSAGGCWRSGSAATSPACTGRRAGRRRCRTRTEARLVVLGPDHPHASGTEVTAARAMVESDPRRARRRARASNRNMLVFVAPDKARLEELRDAARCVPGVEVDHRRARGAQPRRAAAPAGRDADASTSTRRSRSGSARRSSGC